MGGFINDADLWGVAGAMIAVIAGVGLLVAARTLMRRSHHGEYDFTAGYNALAQFIEH